MSNVRNVNLKKSFFEMSTFQIVYFITIYSSIIQHFYRSVQKYSVKHLEVQSHVLPFYNLENLSFFFYKLIVVYNKLFLFVFSFNYPVAQFLVVHWTNHPFPKREGTFCERYKYGPLLFIILWLKLRLSGYFNAELSACAQLLLKKEKKIS